MLLPNDKIKVTAIENEKKIARIYQNNFPNDKVIVADAHQYLLEHYNKFNFIWSSPPCPSHSQIRFNLGFKNRNTKAIYPDMRLYEEIIFLMNYFNGNFVVENTVSFYNPLIKPQIIGGHFIWSNKSIISFKSKNRNHRNGNIESLSEFKGFNIDNYDIENKRQILRNCVEPKLGLHIFNCIHSNKQKQTYLK